MIWRRSLKSVRLGPLWYTTLIGATILSLALLSPLACIIHCALLRQSQQPMHAHHAHQPGQMAHHAMADPVASHDFECGAHVALLATKQSSVPLSSPTPQALYELLPTPDMPGYLPMFLVVALVAFVVLYGPQRRDGPAPPPPRLA